MGGSLINPKPKKLSKRSPFHALNSIPPEIPSKISQLGILLNPTSKPTEKTVKRTRKKSRKGIT
jgi:hypothetical protein